MLIDRFGPLLLAVDYRQPGADAIDAKALAKLVHRICPQLHVVAKVRQANESSNAFTAATLLPENADTSAVPLVAYERGLSFEIRTDPAHDFGIFLDAAKARMFVRAHAAGKRVLNLFSYAGAFGIAAAAGGAADVTNIDPNRDYLAWSRRNAELNGLSMRVLPDTTQDFLGKHLRRLARNPETPGFDLVIVDPPAFCVGRGDERLMRLLWPQVFESLRAMKPNRLVLLCNDKSFRSRQSFAELAQEELGALYRFERLGTCWLGEELSNAQPNLAWKAELEDPHYVEPVVLAGELR
jgi:23S rRNA G2069 N7-methylase RlmK/C1962 C5-methylase RlmI